MRAEADRIALLASSTSVPMEEQATATASTIELWREIAAAARVLDSWMWQAHSEDALLTFEESAVLRSATPMTGDIRLETIAVVGDLTARESESDAALLVQRMDAISHTASAVARALEPLAICGAADMGLEVTYALPTFDCEALNSEYEYGMAGPCRY